MLGQTQITPTVESVTDVLDIINQPPNKGCQRLLSSEDDPLRLYTAAVTVDPLDRAVACGAVNASLQWCSITLTITLRSNFMRTIETVPEDLETQDLAQFWRYCWWNTVLYMVIDGWLA